MTRNTDKMHEYLLKARLPEESSDEHRRYLRRRVLEITERKNTMRAKPSANRLVFVTLILLAAGAAAAAVGVKLYEWEFLGESKSGEQFYRSEREEGVLATVVSPEDGRTIEVEEMQRQLQEIDLLRQQNKRRIIGVVETEWEGSFGRMFEMEYVLSDGTKHQIAEGENMEIIKARDQDLEEIEGLFNQGRSKLIHFTKYEKDGVEAIGETYQFDLADGRKVWWKKPNNEALEKLLPPKKQEQVSDAIQGIVFGEDDALYGGKGEFLGYDTLLFQNREVLLEKYRVELADGTELTVSQGAEKGDEASFGLHRFEETRELRKAGEGSDLGEEEREVEGKKWLFNKKLYVLSDGTEVIESRAGSMDSLD